MPTGSQQRVVIAYLAKAKYGGWPTFTRHLYAALQAADLAPVLRTLGARKAAMPTDFGHGLRCRKVRVQDLLAEASPVIIACADKEHAEAARALVQHGAWIVVHDPAEKHLADIPQERMIVIRQSMQARAPQARLILHPYERCRPMRKPIHAALCHARIDFDKYTHLLLEARDLGADIHIVGASNPMYVHFKIHPRWPDFAPQAFDRVAHAGAALCATAHAVVDMSAIKHDGGGSQYSFLEAWDAGSPLIINQKWIAGFPDDEMQHGVNCLAAVDGAAIKDALDSLADPSLVATLVSNGERTLMRHAPDVIGAEYRTLLAV